MVSKTSILENLGRMSTLFSKTSNPKEALFYSKLAILELCGWIEESMDDIVKNYANRKLRNNDNLKFVKGVIKNVHSFDYHNDFRKMLIPVIGLIRLEMLESKVDQTKLDLMIAALNTLKTQRNPLAHTHIKGATLTIDAPSKTKQQVMYVYEGLKSIEHELKRL